LQKNEHINPSFFHLSFSFFRRRSALIRGVLNEGRYPLFLASQKTTMRSFITNIFGFDAESYQDSGEANKNLPDLNEVITLLLVDT
jgi:hypothetical protein